MYRHHAPRDLNKIDLTQALLAMLWNAKGRKQAGIERRPVFKVLTRVYRLAALNPLPVRQEIWELNQASKFLGKQRR